MSDHELSADIADWITTAEAAELRDRSDGRATNSAGAPQAARGSTGTAC